MSELHDEALVNGNGAAAPEGAGDKPPIQGWQDWVKGLDRLNATIEEKVAAKLDGLTSVVQSAADKPPPEAPYEAPNFEEMTNSELASHMLGTVTDMVENAINKALDPIMSQFDKLQRTVVTNAGTLEMKEMLSTHKDFKDWKDEMMTLATQHPSLGFEEVYQLSRAKNPAKAGELDRRYNPAPQKPRPFGGLTPAMSGKSATPPQSAEEASRAAYNEVMGRHPGILPALQDL